MKENRPKMGNKCDIIIDAAVQVFSRKGYHNTKMEEIAQVADIGKGTIYEYFESKLQLFQEMLSKSLEAYYSDVNSKDLDLPIDKRIQMLLSSHIEFCLKHRELAQIIFRDDILDEELKEWSYKLHKEKENHMQNLIADGIARGELRPVDAKLASMMVTGVVQSVWIPLILEDLQVDTEYLSTRLTDLIMHGLTR